MFVIVDLLTKASHVVAESKTQRQQLKGFLSVQQAKRQDMSMKIKEALRNEIFNSRKHQVLWRSSSGYYCYIIYHCRVKPR